MTGWRLVDDPDVEDLEGGGAVWRVLAVVGMTGHLALQPVVQGFALHTYPVPATPLKVSPKLSDTGEVIAPDLAHRLHDAGLAWSPETGDRFWLPERDLDQTVFTVSDMVVEVRDLPGGRVFAFNGTTEWALDSVEEHEAVWLPRLDQLLDALGAHFLSLVARSGGHVVRVQVGDHAEEHVDVGATDATARALLSVLRAG